ncbi:MAG: hypothetical protein IPJ88_12845 [Myxococcales bacterium]|nr:MAG: hypothetical protein IPJ88_12845 [Myxococcales bacterium]
MKAFFDSLPSLLVVFATLVGINHSRAQAQAVARTAIVVSGDSDQWLVEQAERIEELLRNQPELVLPADSGLNSVLAGVFPANVTSASQRASKLRRKLGAGETRDVAVLRRLGQQIECTSLVVVRRQSHRMFLFMFDVKQAAFFTRSLDLASISDVSLRRYVTIRALAAQNGMPPPPKPLPVVNHGAVQAVQPVDQKENWFEANWHILVSVAVVGVLAGAYFVARNAGDSPQSVIEFSLE